MKSFIKTIVVAAVVALLVVLGVNYINKCDDCGKTYFGSGYEPSILSEVFTEETDAVCRECAETHHSVEIALGKDVEDFRIK